MNLGDIIYLVNIYLFWNDNNRKLLREIESLILDNGNKMFYIFSIYELYDNK